MKQICNLLPDHSATSPTEENYQKIDSLSNKKILRNIALDLGIPKEFSNRKKKGAQYGSGFDKAILRLAKRNGFKLKKRYIESLMID